MNDICAECGLTEDSVVHEQPHSLDAPPVFAIHHRVFEAHAFVSVDEVD